jgi:UDPglucose 6-dehydrogenase
MRISIIGAGYVGLVSGVCLAEKGHEIICVDIDPVKVDQINAGIPPFYEPGLEELLIRNIGSVDATSDLRSAVLQSELSLIAVGTPFDGDQIDLGYVKEAALQIGAVLADKQSYHTVIVKSTVVPGTTDEVIVPLLERASGKRAGVDFGVGANPEFLREGEAVNDFLHPDRVVMGGIDDRTLEVLERLYEPFTNTEKIRTNPRTAETIKYAANGLLATMISFSNEIANLCSAIGDVDVVDVMKGVHLDKRLSPFTSEGDRIKVPFTTYLEAGCGFGGSCFPKDVQALIAHGKKAGYRMRLLNAVMEVNKEQPRAVLELLRKHIPNAAGKRISILGLAFKPGTSDTRESPAIPIIKELVGEGAIIRAFDPFAGAAIAEMFGPGKIELAATLEKAIADAEAILVLTRWPEFTRLESLIEGLANAPVVIDGRRMLDSRCFSKYEGIGLRRASSNGTKESYARACVSDRLLANTVGLLSLLSEDFIGWVGDLAPGLAGCL